LPSCLQAASSASSIKIYFLFHYYSLVDQNQFERACCLALLTNNYDKALEILEEANKEGTFIIYQITITPD
jgi:hypothetical protein